jgi:glyoxylase-like metal-dependent hydrolase (beta-lactamase superfamily II)
VNEELGVGITCIDAMYMRPGTACFYLLQQGDELAIIETGTSLSVPILQDLMHARGLDPAQVRYVIPTHAHLDHAGGAGLMMQRFQQATLVVHPLAARHLIDPAKLVAGATAVYGEARFRELYGEILAVEADRVIAVEDGAVLDLAARQLLIRDTPGHANHHFCVWDESSRGWFSGDVFGVSYPGLRFASGDFLLPTTTPVQFAPEKLLDSIRLLMSYQPQRCYLTHFGEFTQLQAGAEQLRRQIEAYPDIALGCAGSEQRVAAIEGKLWQYTQQQLALAGVPGAPGSYQHLLALDMDLNAQGLDVWLSRNVD